MSKLKSGLKALYGSKAGKILPVLIIAGLVATASASVFVAYYGAATATVQSNDVILQVGSDSVPSCTVYPCGTTTLSTTNDLATISLSFAPSAGGVAQPQSYYTDLLQIHNGAATNSHSIIAIQVANIVDSSSTLGGVSVYYCPSTDPATLAAIATDCPNSFSFTTTSGGSLAGTFPQPLTAGSTGYFVFSAYAKGTATVGQSLTFQIEIQWK